jgi:hypothetical protein
MGSDLKSMYLIRENLKADEYKLRLIHQGHEIKDDSPLYKFKLGDNAQIQVLVVKIE